MTVDAFRTDHDNWQPVAQRRLIWARRLTLVLIAIPVAALGIAGIIWQPTWAWALWIALGTGLVVSVWTWWLIGRRVRSFAYAERVDDLLVVSGILFRRLVIVPYGRMQLVDVKAGPLDRMCGITTVQLHTAAATTDAKIPGLVPDTAATLRDRLARLGEERSAGL
jgi:membrane protein YdbS with pleckstrin-like domain